MLLHALLTEATNVIDAVDSLHEVTGHQTRLTTQCAHSAERFNIESDPLFK